ncbi:beta-defensin 112-like [Suricata suricatta]|uniref:beta-defensin 112-like n=1 Tax=Suricata suricatta TaxID=37032 RepID=UPI001155542C|nr:beta-defensin 112-like [Suricata suricatta]
MEILLSFSVLSFGVFILPVGSDQPVDPIFLPITVTGCTYRFELLEIHNSSEINENAKYSTKENETARSEDPFTPAKRREACMSLRGQCKNECGEKEIQLSHCAVPHTPCCLKECDPIE